MRDCMVSYNRENGIYTIFFLKNMRNRGSHKTSNYHDIGSIVSNWLVNEIL